MAAFVVEKSALVGSWRRSNEGARPHRTGSLISGRRAYVRCVLSKKIESLEPELWERATRHPFLRAVGEGTTHSFGVWLAQDALFVADLIKFQSRLVARAPRLAQAVIAQGVVALIAELDWFDAQAASLGVTLQVEPLEATAAYAAYLHELDTQPYPRAVVGLWLLERVYLDAWRYAESCGAAGPYAAAVAHWTEPAYVSYVVALEEIAEAAVSEFEGSVEDVARSVLTHEVAFWDMAYQVDQ
jgi:formylaminopyrimidine deformylase / aminopyrimidine aminohydrolase